MKVLIGYLDRLIGIVELKNNKLEIYGNKPTITNLLEGMRHNRTDEELLKDLPRALRHYYWAAIQ